MDRTARNPGGPAKIATRGAVPAKFTATRSPALAPATFTAGRSATGATAAGGLRRAFAVTVGERGRVVLPSEVRSRLGLAPGTRMLLTTDPDGTLTLRTRESVAAHGRGMFAHLVPPGVSLVDELIADRRAEAARERRES